MVWSVQQNDAGKYYSEKIIRENPNDNKNTFIADEMEFDTAAQAYSHCQYLNWLDTVTK